jgi:hypothetical protein
MMRWIKCLVMGDGDPQEGERDREDSGISTMEKEVSDILNEMNAGTSPGEDGVTICPIKDFEEDYTGLLIGYKILRYF